MTARIPVPLVDRPYEVVVGRGVLDEVGRCVPAGARRAVVVTQRPVAAAHLAPVEASLQRAGVEVSILQVPDGEPAKSVAVLEDLYLRCAALPLQRSDVVVALGGGVVGDLGGFLAATWNRGVALIQVPTTLLAQVDAAIGGKTGINLPTGKNLVGAFHQPVAVVADLDTLATLGRRTRIEGLGEVVKYGFSHDPAILEVLEAAADPFAPEVVEELVTRSVAVKARVVASDEREAGDRAHLNLGHTYGHALEALTGYRQVLHGEAVAVGLLVALEAGVRMGLTPPELARRAARLLRRVGLPTSAPPLDREAVWATMRRDKKAAGDVRFVLLEGLAAPTVRTVDPAAVDAAIDAVEARA